jgi:hypothetical protein
MRPVCRSTTLLPAMFGPVMTRSWAPASPGGVERDRVRDERLARGEGPLDDRVAAVHDVEHAGVGDLRADVPVPLGGLRQRREHVEEREEPGVPLDRLDGLGDRHPELGEELALELGDLLLGREDLLLELLELLGDVALGVDEGLLPDPRGRHLLLVRVRDLEVVPEDLVVGDLEAGMPVRLLSSAWRRARYCFPPRATSRSSSSGSENPFRMYPPASSLAGGSSTRAAAMRSTVSAQRVSPSRTFASGLAGLVREGELDRGDLAERELERDEVAGAWRGPCRRVPPAARGRRPGGARRAAPRRRRSPGAAPRRRRAAGGSSRRERSGRTSHWRRSRPPIGVSVSSRMPMSEPSRPPCIEATSSRLRRVCGSSAM